MSDTYNELVNYAVRLVGVANKAYLEGKTTAYTVLLFGAGNWIVESFPVAEHNYQAVIDAIHLFWKENPDSKADMGLREGIIDIINNVEDMNTLVKIFNIITYEMDKERNNDTMKIGSTELLEKLRKQIGDKYMIIEKDYSELGNWLEEVNRYTKAMYNVNF